MVFARCERLARLTQTGHATAYLRAKQLWVRSRSLDPMAEPSADRACGCKLWRVAGDRGLHDRLADFESEWQEGSASLRELERAFNQAVLRGALEAAGHAPLDGEIENLYRLLTDDEVTGGMRAQAGSRLEDLGVDEDALRSDFVSYQTVNRHLKSCRSLEGGGRQEALSVAEAEDRLFALRNRLVRVAEATLGQLDRAGAVQFGEIEVFVDVGVSCPECGTQVDLVELFAERSCRCEGP